MKTDIHPEYVECRVHCSCGNEFVTRSTASELRAELCEALAGLNGDQAQVLVLNAGYDYSFSEISRASGMPVGTAKSYAFRARARLRARLDRTGSAVA